MPRHAPRLVAATIVAAIALPASAAADTLSPSATRSLILAGGGRVEVGTRYNVPTYRTGDMLRIDPVVSAAGPRGVLEVLSGAVELRPHGFAPCLGSETEHGGTCVEGTPPALEMGGHPATFGFSFNRLFNTSDADGSSSPSWFGYASFTVTLHVRAADGAVESVRFPLTVTVQQTEVSVEHPPLPTTPFITFGQRPADFPYPVSLYPPLRDRLTSTDPLP